MRHILASRDNVTSEVFSRGIGVAMAERMSLAELVSDLIAHTTEIVRLAQEALGVDIYPVLSGTDLAAADAALTAARRALSDNLELVPEAKTGRPRASVAALRIRAERTQLAVKDALLAAQGKEIETAQAAVSRLRSVQFAEALAQRIPPEASEMGFSRVLFSYIRQGTWLARSAFAGDDREMASTMVKAGAANPRRLAGPLPEYEMVRRGFPILVRDPQADPRVHPELIAATRSRSYVAAPVYAFANPIGLIHADRHTEPSGVCPFDRDVLGMFAEGLGVAFERNMMFERLHALRRAAEDHLRAADALADDFTLEALDIAGPAPELAPAASVSDERSRCHLTARETEVLRGVAEGKTNAQIASALYVTEGTVKSHVKHILRKLGAANRTQAVAKYRQGHGSAIGHITLN